MGYYKDTGSLRNMASAEAVLKRRMPKDIGILPIAELRLSLTACGMARGI